MLLGFILCCLRLFDHLTNVRFSFFPPEWRVESRRFFSIKTQNLSPFTTSRTSENWTSINSLTSFSRATLSPERYQYHMDKTDLITSHIRTSQMLDSTNHKSLTTGLSLCAPLQTLPDVTVQLLQTRYKSISTIKCGKTAPFEVKGNGTAVVVAISQAMLHLMVFM